MTKHISKILLILIALISFNISISAQCNAYYTYVIDSNGYSVQFTDYSYADTSSGDFITNWFWDFGNGTTSTQQNPFIQQMSPGEYNVCLTIITNDSCSSSYCDSIYIVDPCAGFYASANITNETSLGNNGAIDISVFGGTTPYIYNWSNGVSTQDIYNLNSGIYDLTITDNIGCTINESYLVEYDSSSVNPYNTINGNIYAGSNLVPEGIVLLINNNLAIDYTYINNGIFSFDSVQTSEYKLYAIPFFNIGQNYYPKYFPTYNSDVAYWEQSNTFIPNGTTTKNINLVSYSDMYYGDGLISGNVNYTSNSGFETTIYNQNWFAKTEIETQNTAAPNTTVLLLNSNNEIIDYKLTDNQGFFKFENLEYGTYKIYVEKSGKNTQPISVYLSKNNPEDNNIIITIDEFNITNIEKEKIINTNISIYPNPFTDFVVINDFSDRKKTIILKNILSQELINVSSNSNTTTLNLSNIEKGFYTITIIYNDNYIYSKKIIKK